MQSQVRCDDCHMLFDNTAALSNHQLKFCTNSKYADLDTLTNQYTKLQQNRQPSKIPMSPNLKQSQSQAIRSQPSDVDRQYRQLLKQIGDREDLKNRLEREKITAEEEMASLDKKQNQLFVHGRRKQLEEMIKKRQEMAREEEQIQKEIRHFEKQQKQESRLRQHKVDQDFDFREGREAGKLAMQRRLLEEKKREIEISLKNKRREGDKVNKQIDEINDRPIYIPDYKKPEEKPMAKKTYTEAAPREIIPQQGSQIRQSNVKAPAKREPARRQQPKVNHGRSIIGPQHESSVREFSSKGSGMTENEQLLKAALFSGKEKTLFESLNPKNKSDEDIFIESLVAQEYDALNMLARLPKDSQLYAAKLKQYTEMSKMRHELKDKVQKVRLQKVRRQFQMEKQMTETEKANLAWLDQNRRQMLNREVDILKNNQHPKEEYPQQSPYAQPSFPTQSPTLRNQISHTTNKHRPPSNQAFPSIGNIPQGRAESKQGRKGYKITVRSLKNYVSRTPMCVGLHITEEGEDSAKWSFTTKYHDESAPKDDRNPYNPGIRNRADQSGVVVFNQALQVGQDLQNYYNQRQAELYLWILLLEKDEMKISNQPDVYLWYCLKLSHFGCIREGVFTLNLYRQSCPFPYPNDMNRMKGKANEEITIQLAQFFPQPKNELLQTNVRKTNLTDDKNSTTNIFKEDKGKSRGRGRAVKPQPSLQKINSLNNIKQQFFIQNQEVTDFQTVKATTPLSFDLKISAIRTLPSHIGPLKLQIKYISLQEDNVLEGDEIIAQFGDDMYNPLVTYTKKVRKTLIPGSTVALIKIMALQTLTYQPGLLGFCYLHLGFDEEGSLLQTDQKQFLLINGNFQLPILWGNLNEHIPMEQLHKNYPAIPCTSILVSIGDPGFGPSPDYNQGSYNTSFFQVDELDYRLFQQQSRRQKLRTIDYVNGYYKFKGIDVSKYDGGELRKLLSKALAFNSQNMNNLLNLQTLTQYSSTFGIEAAVDGVSLPPDQTSYYYFVTICQQPPASYYRDKIVDLQFIYKIDLASSLTFHLVYEDQPLRYNPEYSPKSALILQLNRIGLNSNNEPTSTIQTVGFSVLSIFDLTKQNPSVDIGPKEIRLFDGEFDQKQLKQLQNNPVRYYELLAGQKKSEFSLHLRVMNGYFKNQWGGNKKGQKGKPLRTIFQNSKGFKTAQSAAVKVIQDVYKVQLK